MNWQDEPFIKWYTRPTPEFLALSIAARGLLPLILSVVDRAGILKVGKLGLKGVAVALHCAWSDIESAVDELAADGRIVFDAEHGAVLIPNHIEAQAASQSDVARQRRSRETARSLFGNGGASNPDVTKRDAAVTECDQSVTKRDEKSRAVTSGHVVSRDVTLEEKRREEIIVDHRTAPPTEPTEPTTAVRKRKPARVVPHRCPKDWAPTEAIYAWALDDGIERDVVDVIAREFVGHWSDPENLVERPGWNMSFKGRVTWLRKNNKLPSPPEPELPIIRHPDRDKYIPKPGEAPATAAVLSLFGVGT